MKKNAKKVAKKVAPKKITAPANVRMSVRIPGTMVADLDGFTALPTGTALVLAARIGIRHAPKELRALFANVAAARVGDVA